MATLTQTRTSASPVPCTASGRSECLLFSIDPIAPAATTATTFSKTRRRTTCHDMDLTTPSLWICGSNPQANACLADRRADNRRLIGRHNNSQGVRQTRTAKRFPTSIQFTSSTSVGNQMGCLAMTSCRLLRGPYRSVWYCIFQTLALALLSSRVSLSTPSSWPPTLSMCGNTASWVKRSWTSSRERRKLNACGAPEENGRQTPSEGVQRQHAHQ